MTISEIIQICDSDQLGALLYDMKLSFRIVHTPKSIIRFTGHLGASNIWYFVGDLEFKETYNK